MHTHTHAHTMLTGSDLTVNMDAQVYIHSELSWTHLHLSLMYLTLSLSQSCLVRLGSCWMIYSRCKRFTQCWSGFLFEVGQPWSGVLQAQALQPMLELAYLVKLGSHAVMYLRQKHFIHCWSCLLCEVGQTWSDVLQTQKLISILKLLIVWAGQPWSDVLQTHDAGVAYLVRLGSHGVMYSRHKCFISMLELPKPWIHSSRNSRVRCGSFSASFSLMDLMKMVLLAGMHSPGHTNKSPKINQQIYTNKICCQVWQIPPPPSSHHHHCVLDTASHSVNQSMFFVFLQW